MNAILLSSALAVIPIPGMLVNVVRLRVKQLAFGHRPLIDTIGLGLADIALTEIINGKLTFESIAPEPTPELAETKVVEFAPTLPRKGKAA